MYRFYFSLGAVKPYRLGYGYQALLNYRAISLLFIVCLKQCGDKLLRTKGT